ncbi:MAG: molybdenum ABC transporter ATP-binding protein [Gammaproteobacteria bacterium]|nr:molybdenum ABC transporter ATP-binding protein [Gammaproteobacteria bacterium]
MTGIEARFQIDWPGFTLDVDLQLPSRGVTALFGHSGSGKTTLLRCISGLESTTKGRLVVDGDVWQDDKHRIPTHKRPIGYVFQEVNLFNHLSVINNLRYGMQRNGKTQQVSLDQAIMLLGIDHLLDRKPDHLSGGERQRVGIARALAVSPRLLLMDEPLAALDLKRKQEILPYLERLHDELDIPVIYVSHSPDEVARLADQLVVMNEGKVQATGCLADMFARLDLPFLVGENASIVLDAIVGELDKDWHMVRVDFDGGSLWIMDHGLPVGHRVRVGILARDVSLAEQPGVSSIQNILRGQIDAIADDRHPGLMLVRVKVGKTLFLARLTKRAATSLAVVQGQKVWLQVKSVALLQYNLS